MSNISSFNNLKEQVKSKLNLTHFNFLDHYSSLVLTPNDLCELVILLINNNKMDFVSIVIAKGGWETFNNGQLCDILKTLYDNNDNSHFILKHKYCENILNLMLAKLYK